MTRDQFPGDHLHVITYNIKAVGKKSTDKTLALIDYIQDQHFDIVMLQEVFDEDTRQLLTDSLSRTYTTLIDRVDYGGWHSLWQDAGLYLCSTYPTIDLSGIDLGEHVHNQGAYFHRLLDKELSITLDAFANKSIAGMLLDVSEGQKILVMTTHAQAFGSTSHKLQQLEDMREVTESVSMAIVEAGICEPDELSIVLTGDFNIDAYSSTDYDQLLQSLGSPRDLHCETNADKVEYSFAAGFFNMVFRYDYVFSWSTLCGMQFRSLEPVSVQIGDVKEKGVSISDHYPVIAVLEI